MGSSFRADIRRIVFERILKDMDNYIARLYTTSLKDMFPITAKIVSRAEWGAQSPRERKVQQSPVDHMVVTWTFTDPCETKEECTKAVQELQREHMSKGATDIHYNFIIGGDGNIYEGRGWSAESVYPSKLLDTKKFVGNSIQIALINQPINKPNYPMLKAIACLFTIGQDDKYLSKTVKYSRVLQDEVLSFTL